MVVNASETQPIDAGHYERSEVISSSAVIQLETGLVALLPRCDIPGKQSDLLFFFPSLSEPISLSPY